MRTKKIEDYGIVNLQVSNVNSPLIIELITEKEEVVATKRISTNQVVTFKNLSPKDYIVRAIYDDNNNGVWDTGNYLLKTYPEKVVYFEAALKLQGNWELNEVFILE